MKSLKGILALLTYCNSSGVWPVESTKSSTWGDYAHVLILQVKALHRCTGKQEICLQIARWLETRLARAGRQSFSGSELWAGQFFYKPFIVVGGRLAFRSAGRPQF